LPARATAPGNKFALHCVIGLDNWARLADHATVVLDTGVPPGDVLHPPQAPRTAAVSTILGAYLWSALLAELDRLATDWGVTLPLWTSSNRGLRNIGTKTSAKR
jgi:uncharacterized phosphosugar-binding protein